MENIEIRNAIKSSGLLQWQVADCYQLSEGNFSRLLRKELSEEKKKKVYKAIEKAKKQYLK